MILTLTKEQFKKRWYFLRLWLNPDQRKEVLTWFYKNKDKINSTTHLEITTQRD